MAKKASHLEELLSIQKNVTGISNAFSSYARENNLVQETEQLIEPYRIQFNQPAINYADKVEAAPRIDAIRSAVVDIANGEMTEFAKEIVSELPEKNLASRYVQIEPRKTKDKAHDDIVKLHEEIITYESTLQRARKGELTEKEVKTLQKQVEDRVKKSIDPSTNAKNKYISKKSKDKLLAVVKSSFENQPVGTAAYYTSESLKRVRGEFEKKFSDDKQRLSYAQKNLVAIAQKEPDRARDYVALVKEGADEEVYGQVRNNYNQLREQEKAENEAKKKKKSGP